MFVKCQRAQAIATNHENKYISHHSSTNLWSSRTSKYLISFKQPNPRLSEPQHQTSQVFWSACWASDLWFDKASVRVDLKGAPKMNRVKPVANLEDLWIWYWLVSIAIGDRYGCFWGLLFVGFDKESMKATRVGICGNIQQKKNQKGKTNIENIVIMNKNETKRLLLKINCHLWSLMVSLSCTM